MFDEDKQWKEEVGTQKVQKIADRKKMCKFSCLNFVRKWTSRGISFRIF